MVQWVSTAVVTSVCKFLRNSTRSLAPIHEVLTLTCDSVGHGQERLSESSERDEPWRASARSRSGNRPPTCRAAHALAKSGENIAGRSST